MIYALLIVASLVAFTSGEDAEQLALERNFIFDRVFAPNQVTLEPSSIEYLVKRLQRVHSHARAEGVTFFSDDQSESQMVDYLVEVSNIVEENCQDGLITSRESFCKYMKDYKNIPAYIEYFNEKQKEFCKNLGIRMTK